MNEARKDERRRKSYKFVRPRAVNGNLLNYIDVFYRAFRGTLFSCYVHSSETCPEGISIVNFAQNLYTRNVCATVMFNFVLYSYLPRLKDGEKN